MYYILLRVFAIKSMARIVTCACTVTICNVLLDSNKDITMHLKSGSCLPSLFSRAVFVHGYGNPAGLAKEKICSDRPDQISSLLDF